MKTFFKITGIIFALLVVTLYLIFLFVLPQKIDLNTYKSDIQKIITESCGLDIEFDDIKLFTTPFLSVGVKIQNIDINFQDGDNFFDAPHAEARIAPLSLLFLTVKSPDITIESPSIYIDIPNGREFKIVETIEDVLNKNINLDKNIESEENPLVLSSLIRIKLSKININDYKIVVKDDATGHFLTLKGGKFFAFYDTNRIKIKTDAQFLSDNTKKINAKINIDSFLPPAPTLDQEDDPAQITDIPFVNPVELYRKYDLKVDLDTKLKIRQKGKMLWLKGYVVADKVSAKFSNYELPKSNIKTIHKGFTVKTDSNLAFKKGQNINLTGDINYGRGPWIDLNIATDKLYFNDFIVFSKALSDAMGIKNNLEELEGKGYLKSDLKLKTNFKNLYSKGAILVKEGGIVNKKYGNIVADINTNILFDDNKMEVKNTKGFMNGTYLKIAGTIAKDSTADIKISLKKMPITGFLLGFVSKEMRNTYNIKKGFLSFDAVINGKLKNAVCALDLKLEKFVLFDKINKITYLNKICYAKLTSDFKVIKGVITNNDFKILIPASKSVIANSNLKININEKDIILSPSFIKVNNESRIDFFGIIQNYKRNSKVNFNAKGNLYTQDLRKLVGTQIAIFLNSNGVIPVKIAYNGNAKVQNFICQMKADASNYITPVNISSVFGKQTLLQVKVRLKDGRLNIKKTGFYVKNVSDSFVEEFEENMLNTSPIFEVSGTLIGIGTSNPSANIVRFVLPKDLDASFPVFKNSKAKVALKTYLYGSLKEPKISGNARIRNVSISDLPLTLNDANLKFDGDRATLDVNKLVLDNSDINLKSVLDFYALPLISLSNVVVLSDYLDLDRLLKISDRATKIMTPANTKQGTSTASSNVPVTIDSGNIYLKRIKSGDITADNVLSKIALRKNIFYLNGLNARIFNGIVRGDIRSNLASGRLFIDMAGRGLNVEKALWAAAKIKDTLSGTASFNAKLTLRGNTYVQQIKSLKGKVDFEIKKGQFGPFGKLENLILAENIRESEFFQTAIGGILDSLATIDTTHFDVLEGEIALNNGLADIVSITSSGNVMTLQLFGNMDILKNDIDIKLRGKLASQLSDVLGPLAVVNPVNLVKQTPGLNVAFASAFRFFTEPVTQEELNNIPSFASNHNDENATKFQIVLNGDLAKPFRLVKSFKWLASQEDLEKAQAFVTNLIQVQEEQRIQEEKDKKNPFHFLKKLKKEEKVKNHSS